MTKNYFILNINKLRTMTKHETSLKEKSPGFYQGWEFVHRFFECKSDSLVKKSELLPTPFCHE